MLFIGTSVSGMALGPLAQNTRVPRRIEAKRLDSKGPGPTHDSEFGGLRFL